MAYVWQPILQKYTLGFITQVQHTIKMTEGSEEQTKILRCKTVARPHLGTHAKYRR